MKKQLILPTLFRNSIANISIYALVYVIASFVRWGFYNPFQWILDMSLYSQDERGMGLFGVAMWQVIQLFIIYKVLEEKRSNTQS